MPGPIGDRSAPMPPAVSARSVMRGLVRPLYVPSAVYSVGVGAAIPAQVLVGLQVGLSPSAVALAVAMSGVAMVVGTWWSGAVVERFGERRALVLATVAGVLPVGVLCALLALDRPEAVIGYVIALAAFNLSDGVWGVARQELMATWVPAPVRGRAVNAYGAAQRSGRLVGPFAAAGLIVLIGPVGGFVLFALASLAGLAVLLTAPEPPHARADASRPAEHAPDAHLAGAVRRAFWIVGAGVLALTIVRAQQEVLLPLWSARVEGLPPEMVSTAMGISLALEMVLFYPAGAALDRLGSLPVICTCLAVMTAGFALLLVPGAFWPAIALIGLGGGIGSGIVKTIGLQLAPAVGRPRFLARWNALAAAGAIGGPLLVALAGSVSVTAAVVATVAVGGSGAIWLAVTGRRHLGH